MKLPRTAQALLTALAILGFSAGAHAGDPLVGRDEPARTEIMRPKSLQLALLRRLHAVNRQIADNLDKKPVPPEVARQIRPHLIAHMKTLRTQIRPVEPKPPARKPTQVRAKPRRPTPAEAGRAPNFKIPSARQR